MDEVIGKDWSAFSAAVRRAGVAIAGLTVTIGSFERQERIERHLMRCAMRRERQRKRRP